MPEGCQHHDMCSSIGPLIGPYYTERLISFLGELYGRVVPGEERDGQACITVCDTVVFTTPLLTQSGLHGSTFPQHHGGIIFLIEMEGL